MYLFHITHQHHQKTFLYENIHNELKLLKLIKNDTFVLDAY